jgi:hypothetical protein
MRKRFHVALCGMTLSVVIGLFMLASGGPAAPPAFAQDTAWDRQMYDNDKIFNQLSSGARFRLEARFGRKAGKVAAPPVQPEPVPFFSPLVPPTNILVNDPAADATLQDTQSETALVLGSGSNIVGAFNDSGSFIGGASKFTGFSQSTDGGATFTDKGTLPTSADGDAGDPVLARSASTGTIFLSTLSFNSDEKLMIFRSTNNGTSFLAPVNGAPGFVSGVDSQDKEWIAVDNFAGTCQGNVYMFWRNFSSNGAKNGMTFTRSTNDGMTWGPSPGLFLASGGQGAFVTVGTDHSVYVFWYDSSVSPRRISMRKSTDCGVSFAPLVAVGSLVGTGTNGDLALNGGFRSNSFPHAAVNPVSGNVYVVYNDCSSAPCSTSADHGNVFFRQSTNGGTTWSAAVKVNDDGTTRDQYMPTIAVTPDGTSLFVPFYDRRADMANSLIGRWAAFATISGPTVTFQPNIQIADTTFPVVIGQDGVINPVYMGDYDMAACDNTSCYTTWGDNRLPHLSHAHQPDVRFAKVPVAGAPGSTITGTILINAVAQASKTVKLKLGASVVSTTTTNGSGQYTFTAVSPGTYKIQILGLSGAGTYSGNVSVNAVGESGKTVKISNGGGTTTTDGIGNFSKAAVPAGNHKVTIKKVDVP